MDTVYGRASYMIWRSESVKFRVFCRQDIYDIHCLVGN